MGEQQQHLYSRATNAGVYIAEKIERKIQWRLDWRAGTDSFPGVPLQGRRIPLESY